MADSIGGNAAIDVEMAVDNEEDDYNDFGPSKPNADQDVHVLNKVAEPSPVESNNEEGINLAHTVGHVPYNICHCLKWRRLKPPLLSYCSTTTTIRPLWLVENTAGKLQLLIENTAWIWVVIAVAGVKNSRVTFSHESIPRAQRSTSIDLVFPQ